MAHVSHQVEGKRRTERSNPTNSWLCHNCSYSNSIAFQDCQYCSQSRFDTAGGPNDSTLPNPNINPNSNYSNSNQSYINHPIHPQQQPQLIIPQVYTHQPGTITTNVTVSVNSHSNDNNKQQIYNDHKHALMNNELIDELEHDLLNQDDEHIYKLSCCQRLCRCISCVFCSFVWLTIGGGLITGILWFLIGFIYCYWFKATFNISKLLLFCSLNYDIETKCKCYDSHGTNEKNCCCDLFFSMIWMILFGSWLTVIHLLFAIIWTPFYLIRIKFCVVHWKLAKISFFNPWSIRTIKKREGPNNPYCCA